MNFVQHYFRQPLSNVFKEDKAEYYAALVNARKTEDLTVFRKFMAVQHIKMLKMELDKVHESQKEHIVKPKDGKGLGMSMIF